MVGYVREEIPLRRRPCAVTVAATVEWGDNVDSAEKLVALACLRGQERGRNGGDETSRGGGMYDEGEEHLAEERRLGCEGGGGGGGGGGRGRGSGGRTHRISL